MNVFRENLFQEWDRRERERDGRTASKPPRGKNSLITGQRAVCPKPTTKGPKGAQPPRDINIRSAPSSGTEPINYQNLFKGASKPATFYYIEKKMLMPSTKVSMRFKETWIGEHFNCVPKRSSLFVFWSSISQTMFRGTVVFHRTVAWKVIKINKCLEWLLDFTWIFFFFCLSDL